MSTWRSTSPSSPDGCGRRSRQVPELRSPLRVGVLLDGLVQPRWVHRLLQAIQAGPIAHIDLLVLAPPLTRPGGRLDRHLLYRAYTWVDDRLFQSPADALQRGSIEQLVAGVPRLCVGAQRPELTQ